MKSINNKRLTVIFMLLVGSIQLYNSQIFSADSYLVGTSVKSSVFSAISRIITLVPERSNDTPLVSPNILFMFLSQSE